MLILDLCKPVLFWIFMFWFYFFTIFFFHYFRQNKRRILVSVMLVFGSKETLYQLPYLSPFLQKVLAPQSSICILTSMVLPASMDYPIILLFCLLSCMTSICHFVSQSLYCRHQGKFCPSLTLIPQRESTSICIMLTESGITHTMLAFLFPSTAVSAQTSFLLLLLQLIFQLQTFWMNRFQWQLKWEWRQCPPLPYQLVLSNLQ